MQEEFDIQQQGALKYNNHDFKKNSNFQCRVQNKVRPCENPHLALSLTVIIMGKWRQENDA